MKSTPLNSLSILLLTSLLACTDDASLVPDDAGNLDGSVGDSGSFTGDGSVPDTLPEPVSCEEDLFAYVPQGAGTKESPYLIVEYCDFNKMAQSTFQEQHWKLTRDFAFDVDVLNQHFDGRGYVVSNFAGTLDGDGHHLSFQLDCDAGKATCENPDASLNRLGVFNFLGGASVDNLSATVTVEHLRDLEGPLTHVGLIGMIDNSELSRIHVDFRVSGNIGHHTNSMAGIGALAAVVHNDSRLDQISVSFTQSGTLTPYAIGAIAGLFCNSTISNSYAEGDVEGALFTGGLTGGCGNGGSEVFIEDSWYRGNLSYTFPIGAPAHPWPPCQMMGAFGSAQGDPVRTNVSNSFWVGSSSDCSGENLPTAAVQPSDAFPSYNQWDSAVWTLSEEDWPSLKT